MLDSTRHSRRSPTAASTAATGRASDNPKLVKRSKLSTLAFSLALAAAASLTAPVRAQELIGEKPELRVFYPRSVAVRPGTAAPTAT